MIRLTIDTHRRKVARLSAALAILTIAGAVVCTPCHAAATKKKGTAAKRTTATKASKSQSAPTGAESTGPTKAATAFVQFCDDWMARLAARERDNVAHIKWETGADGVRGTYTGYSTEHNCTVKDNEKEGATAQITYQEMHYEKAGPTIGEAKDSQPKTVELFDVTEIFHYMKGKWDF